MTVEIATVRTDIADALNVIDDVEVYRYLQSDYHYPAIVVGMPRTIDVRADQGQARDVVIEVEVVCEVTDPESADITLFDLVEQVTVVLLAESAWDVQPATTGSNLLADNRTVIWCRLPVAVFT